MKTKRTIKRVAFFGDGGVSQKDAIYKLAFECANLLAKNGYTMVNGGGPGVMKASTMGAKEVGGKVELVTVSEKNEPKGNYEGQDRENIKLADKIYEEDNYHARIDKLSDIADAFLIFKGGTGTIAEMGYVWSVAKFNHGNHEPVIFVGRGWKNLIYKMDRFLNLEHKELDVIEFANGAKDVLKALKEVSP